jgi:hypothetical protein
LQLDGGLPIAPQDNYQRYIFQVGHDLCGQFASIFLFGRRHYLVYLGDAWAAAIRRAWA